MWEILGIEPTKDIRKIKSAYAKLAKEFNPEEHPDEFRKIYDAYKNACKYARYRSPGKIIPSAAPAEHIPGRNNDEAYLFDNVTDKTDSAPENDKDDFDFSGLSTDDYPEYDDDRPDEYLKIYLRKMNNISKAPKGTDKFSMWQELFSENNYSKAIKDEHFRVKAHNFFRTRSFDRKTAVYIAKTFGRGSYAFITDLLLNEWKVLITFDRKYAPSVFKKDLRIPFKDIGKPGFRNRRPTLTECVIIIVLMLIMIVIPIYYAVKL